jgi:hypothetical protein
MRLSFLIAAITLLNNCGATRADYSFVFTDSSGTAGSAFSFDATQGPLVLKVYLAQSGTDTGLSDTGLKSGGVKLNYDGTVISTTSGAITPNSVANGGQFQAGTKSAGTGTATVRDFNTTTSPVMASTSGTDANRILLGTFAFTGLTINSTTVLTLDPSVTNDNVLGDGTVLDSLINYNSTVSVTVTAVPEPSSLLLAGLLAGGLSVAGWRRRRLFGRGSEQPAPTA